jgi:hypothetical protein
MFTPSTTPDLDLGFGVQSATLAQPTAPSADAIRPLAEFPLRAAQ